MSSFLSSSTLDSDEFPVQQFREEVITNPSRCIVLEAETGAGKTILVPWWCLETGMSVLVAEPLIETVVNTSAYLAKLMGVELGTIVGYRTGDQRLDSGNKTKILYCTTGLATIREIYQQNGLFDVLIIDEFHIGNTDQTVLLAWAWREMQKGTSWFKKIVILSATMETKGISAYLNNAPVFKVPGRRHQIEERSKGRSIGDDVVTLVAKGHDVLVFLPGKKEIYELMAELQSCVDAERIPFHAQLTREEKKLAYASYDRPKVILATNSLETGITVMPSPGRLLAIVDSGLENLIVVRDGFETLVQAAISLAQRDQRKGRTGRNGRGIYVDHCPEPPSKRSKYPTPEIMRTRMDLTVLRVATSGYRLSELLLLHSPSPEVILDAERVCQSLGFLDDKGNITALGKLAARLPISVECSAQVIEAERQGCQEEITIIASIQQAGSILHKNGFWRKHARCRTSDLIAELQVFYAAEAIREEFGNATNEEDNRAFKKLLEDNGIFYPNYFKTLTILRKLETILKAHGFFSHESLESSDEDIIRAILAGMKHHVYKYVMLDRRGRPQYRNSSSVTLRTLNNRSVLDGSSHTPRTIVGTPFDLEIDGRFPGQKITLSLITHATEIQPEWLRD